jgi:hypothetical protein
MGRPLPSDQLVSRVGDGEVAGPEEDDGKGYVPLLAAESGKRNFLSGMAGPATARGAAAATLREMGGSTIETRK